MKTRTVHIAVIFDPAWTSDNYRYQAQMVTKVPDPENHISDPSYSYSRCGGFMSFGSNTAFASGVRTIEINYRDIEPVAELGILNMMEDKVRNRAEEELAKALDPIMARKHELAMLTYKPAKPETVFCEVLQEDVKPFGDEEEDAMFEGHPLFNPED